MNYDINEIKKMIDGIFQETVDIRKKHQQICMRAAFPAWHRT